MLEIACNVWGLFCDLNVFPVIFSGSCKPLDEVELDCKLICVYNETRPYSFKVKQLIKLCVWRFKTSCMF